MEENKTTRLIQVIIPFWIYAIAVIGLFFKIFNPSQEYIISLKYVSLVGYYMILYAFIYLSDLDNLITRILIILNIIFIGIFLALIPFIPDISKTNLTYQQAFNIIEGFVISVTFIILPTITFISTCIDINKKDLLIK